jgi:hypothetical protein
MSFDRALRRPVSTRHAFALAFDLALLRDPLHSIIVPFLLRAPWIVALLVLTSDETRGTKGARLALASLALVGLSVSGWAVDAMLRFRARSVFNTAHGVPPAPALECYEHGLRRLPWLYLTECLRGFALSLGFGAFFFPGVYLGYRLGFATEAVVLNEKHSVAAVQHSLHLSRGRFERWFEMVVVSVLLVLGLLFFGTAVALLVRGLAWETWKIVVPLLVVALWPVFQYAWTFFYLRLVEVEEPQMEEVGPFYAAGGITGSWRPTGGSHPRLTLVEPPPPPAEKREDGSA